MNLMCVRVCVNLDFDFSWDGKMFHFLLSFIDFYNANLI